MNETKRPWVYPEDGNGEDKRDPLKPLIPLADLAKVIGGLLGVMLLFAVIGDVFLAHDNGKSETSSMSELIEAQNKTSAELTIRIERIQATIDALSKQQTAIQLAQIHIEKSERKLRKRLDALSASKLSGSGATSTPDE